MAERLREADRIAAPLLSKQIAMLEATDDELDALPPEEAEAIREYRRGQRADAGEGA